MAWCHQAPSHTWANVDLDLCHHKMSLGHNELTLLHTELETNGCHFSDDIYKLIFLKEMSGILFQISLTFERSNWQYVSIGSDNGLAPNRWQAISWVNVNSDPGRHIPPLDHNFVRLLWPFWTTFEWCHLVYKGNIESTYNLRNFEKQKIWQLAFCLLMAKHC